MHGSKTFCAVSVNIISVQSFIHMKLCWIMAHPLRGKVSYTAVVLQINSRRKNWKLHLLVAMKTNDYHGILMSQLQTTISEYGTHTRFFIPLRHSWLPRPMYSGTVVCRPAGKIRAEHAHSEPSTTRNGQWPRGYLAVSINRLIWLAETILIKYSTNYINILSIIDQSYSFLVQRPGAFHFKKHSTTMELAIAEKSSMASSNVLAIGHSACIGINRLH